MEFLYILGFIVLILSILLIAVNLISDIVSHKRGMTKLRQWSEFNQETLDWSQEIKDTRVREEYLTFITYEIEAKVKLREKSVDSIKFTDIEAKRAEIYSSFHFDFKQGMIIFVPMNCIGIILIALLIWFSYILIKFTRGIIRHNLSMRKIKEWGEFNSKAISWSSQISDPKARSEYITWIGTEFLTKRSADEIKSVDIKKIKLEVSKKWGKHLPELMEEIREEKLNQLLD